MGSSSDSSAEPTSTKPLLKSAKVSKENSKEFVKWLLDGRWIVELTIVIAITGLALWSRQHLIQQPDFVAWDESHFGKFAGWTVKREFYMDVHPPLGKMILGGIAKVAGYDGSFKFDSANVYPNSVPYVFMRRACATISAASVPLIYLTSRELGFSRQASILSASMIMLDMAHVALGRLILIDAMLLFGTTMALYFLAGFRRRHDQPFEISWWTWLFLLGFALGFTVSVKWVGLFVIALVGLYTVSDLWMLLCDKNVSVARWMQHFLARALCLIAVPITIYVLAFVAHFAILTNSGQGDATMPSLFQANLNGSTLGTHPSWLAYGSVVSMRNNALDGALLHSHVQTFPAGSKQQQVTAYPHHDGNNYWQVVKASARAVDPFSEGVQFVKDGDIIILRHNSTKKNLHSHLVAAPLTKTANEVSCYGGADWGDENDKWRIEIIKDDILGKDAQNRIHSLTTLFRLRHLVTNCTLWTQSIPLPEWGFRQHEVICHKKPTNVINTHWNVEEHFNSRLPRNTGIPAKLPFWKAFIELNAAMWTSNNALLPDLTKVDELASPPSWWPLMHKGIRMTAWSETGPRVYMLGNPVLWWGGLIAGVLWFFVALLHQIYLSRWNDSYDHFMFSPDEWQTFYVSGRLMFGGWMLHYLPYFFMPRLTYLHHYVPATLFLALICGLMCDYLTAVGVWLASYLESRWQQTPILKTTRSWFEHVKSEPLITHVAVLLLSAVVFVFAHFYPLPYGMHGPLALFTHLQWRPTWHIV